jgi:hypothetical protein
MAIYYNPRLDFIQKYKVDGLAGLRGTGPTDPMFRLDFEPDTPPVQQQMIIQAAQSWDWQPLPVPLLRSFYSALWLNTGISAIDKTSLIGMLTPLNGFIMDDTAIPALQEAWAAIKANPPGWLTDTIVQIVELYARQFHIPII